MSGPGLLKLSESAVLKFWKTKAPEFIQWQTKPASQPPLRGLAPFSV